MPAYTLMHETRVHSWVCELFTHTPATGADLRRGAVPRGAGRQRARALCVCMCACACVLCSTPGERVRHFCAFLVCVCRCVARTVGVIGRGGEGGFIAWMPRLHRGGLPTRRTPRFACVCAFAHVNVCVRPCMHVCEVVCIVVGVLCVRLCACAWLSVRLRVHAHVCMCLCV